MTNARNKLNAAYLHGIIAMAGIVALLFQSWTVFWLLAGLLALTSCLSGDIRLKGRRR